jgi:hypothetical protein
MRNEKVDNARKTASGIREQSRAFIFLLKRRGLRENNMIPPSEWFNPVSNTAPISIPDPRFGKSIDLKD